MKFSGFIKRVLPFSFWLFHLAWENNFGFGKDKSKKSKTSYFGKLKMSENHQQVTSKKEQDEQRVRNEQQADSNEQQAKSNKQQAKSNNHRIESNEKLPQSNNQRAKSTK